MTVDPDLDAFAHEAQLVRAGETPVWTPLSGGVSSDIWRLDSGGRSYCLKRALARLRVADDWTAPVERNLYEWRWFETVGARFPDLAPRLVARDEARGVFAMAFLDAETAWWGDPAFDLAFCLNHLLLKQRVAPQATAALDASFDALASAYLAHVDWEDQTALEARAATLLPGLLLARVDGKSPVEYLPAEADRAPVRRVAMGLLREPVETLDGVRAAWARIQA